MVLRGATMKINQWVTAKIRLNRFDPGLNGV